MNLNELERRVREHFPGYRCYEARQIEDMRERLAAYGSGLSGALARLMRLDKLVVALNERRAMLRREKRYEEADALRDILESAGVEVRDDTA